MSDAIFKNKESRNRIEHWYQRFLNRVDGDAHSIEVTTSHGASHVLMVGDSSNPPLICLHAMMTSSAELGALLNRFYLILIYLPGQSVRGLPVHLSYTNNSHARWLQGIFDELTVQKAPILGVSLGGFVARFTCFGFSKILPLPLNSFIYSYLNLFTCYLLVCFI